MPASRAAGTEKRMEAGGGGDHVREEGNGGSTKDGTAEGKRLMFGWRMEMEAEREQKMKRMRRGIRCRGDKGMLRND